MAEVNVCLSDEAKLLVKECKINVPDFMTWFNNVRKIWIGGGDVVTYLKYKESKGGK